MTNPPRDATPRCLLLDVEGTTTPVAFVYEVLFPYVRAHLKDYLLQHLSAPAVQADIARLREEHEADSRKGLDPPPLRDGPHGALLESLTAYLHWLMDRDRKATPLKSLQGKVWEEGYRAGRLRAGVFPDVPRAFERWRASGKEISIFSSGSVLAQKLLFKHTTAGDLTGFIRSYFDTTTGAKNSPTSYAQIADALGHSPPEVIFISDTPGELDAAREAGMGTFLRLGDGGSARTPAGGHAAIHTFDAVLP